MPAADANEDEDELVPDNGAVASAEVAASAKEDISASASTGKSSSKNIT